MTLRSYGWMLGTALAVVGCVAETDGDALGDADIGGRNVHWDVDTDAGAASAFEAYRDSVLHEPGADGVYIVDGDVPIPDEKRLREHWERRAGAPGALILHQWSGQDARWDRARASNLTYCVSTGFGARYEMVVDAMEAAAEEWEAAAAVDFVHLPEEDGDCTAYNERVLFDVREVGSGDYLARAFFPGYGRRHRNLLIDRSSFLPSGAELSLVGVLRHELGHAIGFRHEHARPESGACREDAQWRALTDYDRASAMHYPHCNGIDSWALELSDRDRAGASRLYGPPHEEGVPEEPAQASSHRGLGGG